MFVMAPSRNLCAVCKKALRKRQHVLQCDKCRCWEHRTCGKTVDLETYRLMVKGDINIPGWNCSLCRGKPTSGPQRPWGTGDLVDPDGIILDCKSPPRAEGLSDIVQQLPSPKMDLRINSPTEPSPTYTTSTQFDLDFSQIPDGFLQKDIKLKDARHLVFATANQLKLLSRAKKWFMGSTFRIVQHPFKQLLSINIFVRSGESCKQVPVCIVLMTRMGAEDYRIVLNEILSAIGQEVSLTEFILDYEAALWVTLNELFPDVKKSGCSFRFRQAVHQNVRSRSLSAAYQNDLRTKTFIRQLMSLCLLPPTLMKNCYHRLKDKLTDSKNLKELYDYVGQTCIKNSIWTVENVSVYGAEVRTNNDLKGWHNRLYTLGRNNMALYDLIHVLHCETKVVDLTVEFVRQGKITRRQKKTSLALNEKLFQTWRSYEDGVISPDLLLEELCKL